MCGAQQLPVLLIANHKLSHVIIFGRILEFSRRSTGNRGNRKTERVNKPTAFRFILRGKTYLYDHDLTSTTC